EGVLIQNSLPTQLLTCNANNVLNYTPAFLDSVNNKSAELHIVFPLQNGQYRILQVKQAFRFVHSPTEISAASASYRFSYSPDGRSANGDLSGNDARGRVFLHNQEPRYGQNCLLFRQMQGSAGDYLDILIHPELGVLEEKPASGAEKFSLKRINGKTPEEFFTTPALTRQSDNTLASKSGAAPASDSIKVSTPPPPPSKKHLVKKGESLYAIARTHKLTVLQLQQWNNLGASTLIQPETYLLLEAPQGDVLKEFNWYANDLSTRGTLDFTSKDGVPVELRNENTAFYETTAPTWLQAPESVVVAQGETAAMLAARYGYTEARFRYFNQLAPTAVLKAGDVLRTRDCEAPNQGPDSTPMGYDEMGWGKKGIEEAKNSSYQDPYWAEFTQTPASDAKSPAAASSRSAVPPTTSQDYYGPVPGIYNSNRPLTEPAKPQELPRSLSAPAPYDNIPSGYDQMSGMTNKGVPQAQMKTNAARRIHIVLSGETLEDVARRFGLTVEALRRLNNMAPGETILPYQSIYVN
ncbi:MAG: LysM peptidoglycan-binding domain-containing protein, partial [Haliscomenobacter sp.]